MLLIVTFNTVRSPCRREILDKNQVWRLVRSPMMFDAYCSRGREIESHYVTVGDYILERLFAYEMQEVSGKRRAVRVRPRTSHEPDDEPLKVPCLGKAQPRLLRKL